MAKTKHYTGPEVLEMVGQYMSDSDAENVKKPMSGRQNYTKSRNVNQGNHILFTPFKLPVF
ncbi:hypothetical protein GCM10025879_18420 [Leuconostoc litchii]|nr:hypothetical protein GCM10025879_18420 [Leuconostoc litchii]